MINFINEILYRLGLKTREEPQEAKPASVEDQTEPKRSKIAIEPAFIMKQGQWVLVVEHKFNNIPSWVEWDGEREVLTITQMNGDIDEADLVLKSEAYESLKSTHRVILVSNDNKERIVQNVKFVARI